MLHEHRLLPKALINVELMTAVLLYQGKAFLC